MFNESVNSDGRTTDGCMGLFGLGHEREGTGKKLQYASMYACSMLPAAAYRNGLPLQLCYDKYSKSIDR